MSVLSCFRARVSDGIIKRNVSTSWGEATMRGSVTTIRTYTLAPGAEQHIRRKSSRACQNDIGTTRGRLFVWEGLCVVYVAETHTKRSGDFICLQVERTLINLYTHMHTASVQYTYQ
jgi:hypothetical protein